VPLLQALAEGGAWSVSGGAAKLLWKKFYPVPLVTVKLNGQSVLMALDTGTADLLVDQSFAKRCGIDPLAGQSLVFWDGSRVAVRNAVVKRIEIGGVRVEKVPAGILSLHKWSNLVNSLGEPVAGVIGLNLLQRFTPTLDYAHRRLELAPRSAEAVAAPGAVRLPFEMWGESEMMVYGSLAGGRRMALVVATGLPAAGIGAPAEVMEEIGLKPGGMSRLMKGAGAFMGGHAWYEVGVPSVTVGPLARDKVDGWSGPLDSSELWRHGVRRDAVLGGEFFHDRRVTIDWQRHELVVEE
jgi:predicted aspartyl protease